MNKIFIALTKTGTFAGNIVSGSVKLYRPKELTEGRVLYSHASISFDSSLSKMYSFARKGVYNPFNAGFITEDIKKGMFAKKPNTKMAVFSMNVSTTQYENILYTIKDFCNREDELGYNFSSIFGVLVGGIEKKLNDKFCCSQFVAKLLKDNGFDIFDLDISVITPFDIYVKLVEHKYEKIYEGLLSEYPHYEKTTSYECDDNTFVNNYALKLVNK